MVRTAVFSNEETVYLIKETEELGDYCRFVQQFYWLNTVDLLISPINKN